MNLCVFLTFCSVRLRCESPWGLLRYQHISYYSRISFCRIWVFVILQGLGLRISRSHHWSMSTVSGPSRGGRFLCCRVCGCCQPSSPASSGLGVHRPPSAVFLKNLGACRRRKPRTRVDVMAPKDVSPPETFPMPALRLDLTPRCSPLACAEKLSRMDLHSGVRARWCGDTRRGGGVGSNPRGLLLGAHKRAVGRRRAARPCSR